MAKKTQFYLGIACKKKICLYNHSQSTILDRRDRGVEKYIFYLIAPNGEAALSRPNSRLNNHLQWWIALSESS
jgi:hypothetical protein